MVIYLDLASSLYLLPAKPFPSVPIDLNHKLRDELNLKRNGNSQWEIINNMHVIKV